jgi:hypothetical protein
MALSSPVRRVPQKTHRWIDETSAGTYSRLPVSLIPKLAAALSAIRDPSALLLAGQKHRRPAGYLGKMVSLGRFSLQGRSTAVANPGCIHRRLTLPTMSALL